MNRKIYDCILFQNNEKLLKERIRYTKNFVDKQIILVDQRNRSFNIEKTFFNGVDIFRFNQDNLLTGLVEKIKSFDVHPLDLISFSNENEFPDFNNINFDHLELENKHIIFYQKSYVWDLNHNSDVIIQGTKIFSVNYLFTQKNKANPYINTKKYINDNREIVIDNGFVILGQNKNEQLFDKILKKELIFPHPYVQDFMRVNCSETRETQRKKPKIILINLDSDYNFNESIYDEIINVKKEIFLVPENQLYTSKDFIEEFYINESKSKIKELFLLDIDIIHLKYKNSLIETDWSKIKNKTLSSLVFKEKTLD